MLIQHFYMKAQPGPENSEPGSSLCVSSHSGAKLWSDMVCDHKVIKLVSDTYT